ncbi:MAG: hypothetical protein WCF36_04960 [Candidatus Nanopelagicales bacterium]
MRRFITSVVGAAALGMLVATVPAGSASAARHVPDRLFGQHIGGIAAGVPATLPSVGAVRLWDSGVTWRQVETRNNVYDWTKLDAAVTNARKMRAGEIMYTLGSTPKWAANSASLRSANARLALYGPGSNSHPRADSLYLDYLRVVAKRYKGRITSYQVWNEANLKDFYLGSPRQMAKLTKSARAVLKKADPRAKLVAASTTVRSKGPVGSFSKTYGKEMKRVRWPVDAVSAHLYPPANSGPNTRVSYIKVLQKYYKKYGARSKPLWDTEMNYGDLRTYMPKREYTGATAATYVARTYIDSMRYRVPRVFWYGWDKQILGTNMTTKAGALTSGGKAFQVIRGWMSGATWYSCTTRSTITSCTIKPRGGKKQTIGYTTGGSKSYKVAKGTTLLRRLDGSSTRVKKGQRITLTTQPVLFS